MVVPILGAIMAVSYRVVRLLENLGVRVEKLEGRVDKLEERMDRFEERMDNLARKVDEILFFISHKFKKRRRRR